MPSLAARKVDFTQGRLPPTLMPVMSSVDRETRQLQLLLVMGVDDFLGGVVRLNGTLYPAFAVPSADNSQLVISALTDKGLRYAGYSAAVNQEVQIASDITCKAGTHGVSLKPVRAMGGRRQSTQQHDSQEKSKIYLVRARWFHRVFGRMAARGRARTHTTERRHDCGYQQ